MSGGLLAVARTAADAVEADALVDDLRTLVRVPSVTGDEDAIAAQLSDVRLACPVHALTGQGVSWQVAHAAGLFRQADEVLGF